MKDTILIDMVNIISNTNAETCNNTLGGSWITWGLILFILLVIVLIVVKRRKRYPAYDVTSDLKNIDESTGKDINFDNLMVNAFKAAPFYNKMIKKVHPDNFVGDDVKVAKATQIMADMGKYKTDYQKLVELQKHAEKELGISFE